MFIIDSNGHTGFCRLTEPNSGKQKGGLRRVVLGGKPIKDEGYRLDEHDKLSFHDLIITQSETRVLRPRTEFFYGREMVDEESFVFQKPNLKVHKHDPNSRFPNKWELEELVHHINHYYNDLATINIQRTINSDIEKEDDLNICTATINYFIRR